MSALQDTVSQDSLRLEATEVPSCVGSLEEGEDTFRCRKSLTGCTETTVKAVSIS